MSVKARVLELRYVLAPRSEELVWYTTRLITDSMEKDTVECFVEVASRLRYASPSTIDWAMEIILIEFERYDLLKIVQTSLELIK